MNNTQEKNNNNKAGRQSKYFTNVQPHLLLIEKWARNGDTDKTICEKLKISQETFIIYKNQYSELSETLKRGKEVIDTHVENALLKRALGYEYEEVIKEKNLLTGEMVETKRVTKHVSPDTTAQIFWLKNRLPKDWRDKRDIDVSGNMEVFNKGGLKETLEALKGD